MMMAFYMFCACAALQVGLSYLLPKLPDEDPQRLYWAHPLDALISPATPIDRQQRKGPSSGLGRKARTQGAWLAFADYRVVAVLVFAIMVGLYVVFR